MPPDRGDMKRKNGVEKVKTKEPNPKYKNTKKIHITDRDEVRSDDMVEKE